MTFSRRMIDVTFQLSEGTFSASGSNTVKLSGLRVGCHIENCGGPGMGRADINIYGMPLDTMNELSTLGMRVKAVPTNLVKIEAGNDQDAKTLVFVGTIINAWTDFNSQPMNVFNVQAFALGAQAVKLVQPKSYSGSVDVAGVMNSIATDMDLRFENNGVTVKLNNVYLSGSPRDQALKLVHDSGIKWNGGEGGVLAIWPANGSRGGAIPLISSETGMIGYPSFIANGILLNTVFNPSIGYGGKIKVYSAPFDKPLKTLSANGVWTTFKLDHTLESQIPDGEWKTTISAYNPNSPIAPPVAGT